MSVQLSSKCCGLLWAAALFATPLLAQTPASPCRQQMWADARAVAADLVEIRNQVSAEIHQAAVEKFAQSLEALLPALSQPAQAAIEKFLIELRDLAADDPESGVSFAPVRRLRLANGLVAVLVAAGAANDEVREALVNLATAYLEAEGISTAALDSDLKKLAAEARTCRA